MIKGRPARNLLTRSARGTLSISVLSTDLEFRRADGSVVNKQKFIEELADRRAGDLALAGDQRLGTIGLRVMQLAELVQGSR